MWLHYICVENALSDVEVFYIALAGSVLDGVGLVNNGPQVGYPGPQAMAVVGIP